MVSKQILEQIVDSLLEDALDEGFFKSLGSSARKTINAVKTAVSDVKAGFNEPSTPKAAPTPSAEPEAPAFNPTNAQKEHLIKHAWSLGMEHKPGQHRDVAWKNAQEHIRYVNSAKKGNAVDLKHWHGASLSNSAIRDKTGI